MHDSVLIGAVSILTVGVLAQWAASRLKIPSILLLLFFGFMMGPVTGFLHPDQLLGDLLFPLVSIAVAIILFEGGLSLKISDLKQVGSAVRNIIIIGVPLMLFCGYLAAIFFLKVESGIALLIGAILVVTGPTVIMPMLKSVCFSDRVASVLRWEAMLNDCVGAILAVLVFESIVSHETLQSPAMATLILLVKTLAVGFGIGFVCTWFMILCFRKYWVPDHLHSVFTLMIVVLSFTISNLLQHESGLIAATMTGIFLANQRKIPVKHIVEFKESLTILAVSGLFIILASRLKIEYVTNIGFGEIGFIIFLIFVARPVSVFISMIGTGLSWKETALVSALAPRGIVAAAVGSIFALKLEELNYPDADKLLPVVFLVIIATVIFYGLVTPAFARKLELVKPNPQGILFVGAQWWARKIAEEIQNQGFHILMVDSNDQNIYDAHLSLLPAIRLNILDEGAAEELNLLGIGRMLALTPNDQVNTLASLHLADEFGRPEVYQLYFTGAKRKDLKGADKKVHGRFLFTDGMSFSKISDFFEKGAQVKSFMLSKDYDYEAFEREYKNQYIPLFLVTGPDELRVMTVDNSPEPKSGQTLIALILSASSS